MRLGTSARTGPLDVALVDGTEWEENAVLDQSNQSQEISLHTPGP